MKKISLLALAGIAFLTACAAESGDAKVELAKDVKEFDNIKTLVVSYSTIENMLSAKRMEDLKVEYDTIEVRNRKAEFKLADVGAAKYTIAVLPDYFVDFFASPGEKIDVKVNSATSGDFSVTGTPLMDGITEIESNLRPVNQEYRDLMSKGSGNVKQEQVEALMKKYDATLLDFIKKNPDSPAVPYAIMDLSGVQFMDAYNGMTADAKKSILMPFLAPMKAQVEEQAKSEALQKELRSGNVTAPNFTFKNLEGKDVSLSDFRGKYVVIDFWGSWCGWCIKGFPALKEAYKKYGDKLVILGVDCNDSEEAWREAVKKYELPWVQVYNNHKDGKLYAEYGIQGFPTKVIVSPEGKIVDLTVGEDPSFFDRLADFMK